MALDLLLVVAVRFSTLLNFNIADNRVRLWSTAPVLDASIEQSDAPKLLTELTNHVAPVNAVRWSPSGQILASAADDKFIILYHRTNDSTAVFGAEKSVENWSVFHMFTGHTAGVSYDVVFRNANRCG